MSSYWKDVCVIGDTAVAMTTAELAKKPWGKSDIPIYKDIDVPDEGMVTIGGRDWYCLSGQPYDPVILKAELEADKAEKVMAAQADQDIIDRIPKAQAEPI